jgi:FKBP-type peptidyl-prolyl cis-trans isomerase FklB
MRAALSLALVLLLGGCGEQPRETAGDAAGAGPSSTPLDSDGRRQGYALGYQLGEQLRDEETSLSLDPTATASGLRDALEGLESRLTSAERELAFRAIEASQAQAAMAEAERNRSEGSAFLAANRNNPDVVELPSGLQYRVFSPGTGRSPGPNDVVRVHYRGTLIDGTEFDSSFSRGKPAVLPVGQVIEGWQQALLKMQPGARWQLYVPPDLGYGQRGNGDVIGANATLIFDVELLGIE